MFLVNLVDAFNDKIDLKNYICACKRIFASIC